MLDVIPMMTEQEFASLVRSIRMLGQVRPIARTRDGTILDGRCRLMACLAAGVEPLFQTVAEDQEAFIFSANILRHHVTPSQKAVYHAVLAREGVDPDDPQILPEARIVANHRDLADRVMKGNLWLGDALRQALERQKQEALVADQAKRFARVRTQAPYLALQVDEGKLAVDQAVATAEYEAAAPALAEHAEAIRAAGKRVVADIIEIGRRLTELGLGLSAKWTAECRTPPA